MANRPLEVPFETSGDWFLPDSPGRTIAGTLKYAKNRATLHLHDAFVPMTGNFPTRDLQRYPIIHGFTREGERVTLINCVRSTSFFHANPNGSRQPEQIVSYLVVFGAYVLSDQGYSTMSFRIPGLQIWLSRQIFRASHETNHATNRLATLYRVEEVPSETTRIDEICASIDWWISIQFNNVLDFYTEVNVRASAGVLIRPDSPQPIDWFFEQFRKLNTILAFFAGSPMSPDLIEASIHGNPGDLSVLVALKDSQFCEHKTINDFYMARLAMGVELSDAIINWFHVYPKIHSASQLALSVFASDKLWLYIEFLVVSQFESPAIWHAYSMR